MLGTVGVAVLAVVAGFGLGRAAPTEAELLAAARSALANWAAYSSSVSAIASLVMNDPPA